MSSLVKAMVFPLGVNGTPLNLLQKLLLQGAGEKLKVTAFVKIPYFYLLSTLHPLPLILFLTSAKSLLCNQKLRLIYQLNVFNV